jgi:hypothetical protein
MGLNTRPTEGFAQSGYVSIIVIEEANETFAKGFKAALCSVSEQWPQVLGESLENWLDAVSAVQPNQQSEVLHAVSEVWEVRRPALNASGKLLRQVMEELSRSDAKLLKFSRVPVACFEQYGMQRVSPRAWEICEFAESA